MGWACRLDGRRGCRFPFGAERAMDGRSEASLLPSASKVPGVDAHSIGWIGVVGHSSSRAPRTAASRVKRWAGSVAA